MKSINIQAFDSFYQSTVVNNDNFSIIDSIVRSFPYFHTTISGLLPLWIVVIVIFAIGWLAAKILRSLIAKRLKEAKFDQLSKKVRLDEPYTKLGVKKGLSYLIGQIVFWFILNMLVITTLGQTGIDTEMISNNIILIVGIILLAGYIAYAYAAKYILSNMFLLFFEKNNFKVGQNMKVKDIVGVIGIIDNSSVTFNIRKSRIMIPAKEQVNNPVEIFNNH